LWGRLLVYIKYASGRFGGLQALRESSFLPVVGKAVSLHKIRKREIWRAASPPRIFFSACCGEGC
jgi:hypothetical protein